MKELRKTTENMQWMGQEQMICYRLFEQPGEGRSCYGVSVENPNTGEYAVVEDVTLERDRAEQLMDLLTVGQVTPVSLREIVEDFIA